MIQVSGLRSMEKTCFSQRPETRHQKPDTWTYGKEGMLGKLIKKTGDQKGIVLVVVMSFAALIVLSTLSLSTIVKRDIELVGSVKYRAQARYLAEAGISHALARIKQEDFSSRSDLNSSLDIGSYSVSFSEAGGRYLVTSVGTAYGMTRTVTAEIENLAPTAMRYSCIAGNNIGINGSGKTVDIEGDIHANNNVYLKCSWLSGSITITGDVSATGIVKEGSKLHRRDGFWGGWQDWKVYINGLNDDKAEVGEDDSKASFPSFDYEKYREEAIDSGDYYDTDQVFDSVNLDPGNGIVFVDGRVTFEGNSTIRGGVVADDITINGALTQYKSGERNVIIAREGDIGLRGDLDVEEAVVYSVKDIRTDASGVDITIDGVMMARRDINMWTNPANMDYDYVEIYPSDVGSGGEEQTFAVVSWNR